MARVISPLHHQLIMLFITNTPFFVRTTVPLPFYSAIIHCSKGPTPPRTFDYTYFAFLATISALLLALLFSGFDVAT